MTISHLMRLRRIAGLGGLLIVAVLIAAVLAGQVAAHHGKGGHAGDFTPIEKIRYDVSLTLRDSENSTDVTFECSDCADDKLGFSILNLDPPPELMVKKIHDVAFAFHHKWGVTVWLAEVDSHIHATPQGDDEGRLFNSCSKDPNANRCYVPATPIDSGGVITITLEELVDMIKTHAPDKGEKVGEVYLVNAVFTPHDGP